MAPWSRRLRRARRNLRSRLGTHLDWRFTLTRNRLLFPPVAQPNSVTHILPPRSWCLFITRRTLRMRRSAPDGDLPYGFTASVSKALRAPALYIPATNEVILYLLSELCESAAV